VVLDQMVKFPSGKERSANYQMNVLNYVLLSARHCSFKE